MTVMKKSNKDDAVSPVIGVMLMLVVTIIVAALVSSFAGGVTASQERAPVATLDVVVSAAVVPSGNIDSFVQVKHLGGETINTGDLRIVTTYTVPEKYEGSNKNTVHAGKVIRHTIDGSLEHSSENYLDTTLDGYPFVPQVNTIQGSLSLTYIGVGKGSYFSNSQLRSGQVMKINKWEFFGFDTNEKTLYGFGEGSVVHVTISDIPSNKILFDKDVIVTW